MRNTHKALKNLLHRTLWWVLWFLRLVRRRRYRQQQRQQQRRQRSDRRRRCRRRRAVRFGLRFQTKRQRRSAAADRQRTARGQRGWCPGNPQPTVADCGPHRVHTQTPDTGTDLPGRLRRRRTTDSCLFLPNNS